MNGVGVPTEKCQHSNTASIGQCNTCIDQPTSQSDVHSAHQYNGREDSSVKQEM
jgi:hypothetical protein